jgi:CDGSH-type Zn-finger protein
MPEYGTYDKCLKFVTVSEDLVRGGDVQHTPYCDGLRLPIGLCGPEGKGWEVKDTDREEGEHV